MPTGETAKNLRGPTMPNPIDICFYAQDPLEGRFVATSVEGMGQIHLVSEGGDATLCGRETEGLALGAVRGELDRSHSDLFQRCAKADE